jgi:hypothetical protein
VANVEAMHEDNDTAVFKVYASSSEIAAEAAALLDITQLDVPVPLFVSL